MSFFKYRSDFYSRGIYSIEKTIARERARNREFVIYLLIYLNKLAYLQLITATLLKMNFFLGTFKGFCLKVSEDIMQSEKSKRGSVCIYIYSSSKKSMTFDLLPN